MNEIIPPLKRFPAVHWARIYDQFGRTERPNWLVTPGPSCAGTAA